MTMDDIQLKRLSDEAAIRDTIFAFADYGTRGDAEGMRSVWAPDAIWEQGDPVNACNQGLDEIMAYFHKLRDSCSHFLQLAQPGPIVFDGGQAFVRTLTAEWATGENDFYMKLRGINFDTLRPEGDRWVFTKRSFEFHFLDHSPFPGDAFKRSADRRR